MLFHRFVTAFRQWLDDNGGSVGWAPGVSTALPPRETSREVLLDRYESHTKHCSSCSKVRLCQARHMPRDEPACGRWPASRFNASAFHLRTVSSHLLVLGCRLWRLSRLREQRLQSPAWACCSAYRPRWVEARRLSPRCPLACSLPLRQAEWHGGWHPTGCRSSITWTTSTRSTIRRSPL